MGILTVTGPVGVSSVGSKRRSATVLAGILLLAILARLAVMIYFRTYDISSERDHWGFGFEAGRIARSLAMGQGFSSPLVEPSGPTAFLPPVYPFLLAGIFKIFGIYTAASAVAAYLLNTLLSVLTCIGLHRLGERIFGAKVGLASAFLFALYPPSIWHAVSTIWDTTLTALALVVLMNWLYNLPHRPTTSQLVQTGSLMGLIGLINPAPLFFYPVVAVIVWIRLRKQGLNGMIGAASLTVSCMLVLLPWLARNAVMLGVFTPRTSIGLNLRLGNCPGAWRLGTGAYDPSIYPSDSAEEARLYRGLGEVAYDRRCARLAWEFISNNPGKFAALTLKRARAWWFGQGGDWTGHFKTSFSLSILKRLAALLLLPFFALGCIVAWRKRQAVRLLLALVLIYPISYCFLIVSERYRFPVEPFLLLVATYGLFASASALTYAKSVFQGREIRLATDT